MIPDLNDYIVKNIGERKDKFFKMLCNSCNSDRGYLLKAQDKRPSCNKCAKIGNKAGNKTRELMSKAAMGNKNSSIEHRKQISNREKIDGRSIRCISTYARGYGVPKEQVKLRHNIKTLISQKLKRRSVKKDLHLYEGLNYSIGDLKKHLESKFQEGMSWENYGSWHIDHIIPDSWFNYSSMKDEDFKKSWSLENLQPLWAKDNLKKSNRIAGGVPFLSQ